MVLAPVSLSYSASPRWETLRSPSRKTVGGRIARVAHEFGQPFMPWQQLVADVGGEIDPDTGLPAYREVIVTVMRQNGKTTLVVAVQCERCLLRGVRQRVAYTAQTGLDGRQKFVEDVFPVLENSPLDELVERYYRAADNTGIVWKNGSRISVLSTGKESGHGKTLHLAVIDEAFADVDDRREQALLPAMIRVADAQIWNISTAGDEGSAYLKRKIEIGRAAAESGSRSGIAYFEWSIPDDEDMDSPDVWARYMPAYEVTIGERALRHARSTMSDGEFRRAFGNQWTVSENRVIPLEAWEKVKVPTAHPFDPSHFAVDISPDRSWSSIAVANSTFGEIVDHQKGMGWVLDRILELSVKWKCPVVIDAVGPAGNLIDPLEGAGVTVQKYEARQYAYACQSFFDRVINQKIKAIYHPALEDAMAGATKRTIMDGWGWNRRESNTVISPLVALTLAMDAANLSDKTPVPWIL